MKGSSVLYILFVMLIGCSGAETKNIEQQAAVTHNINSKSVKGMSCEALENKRKEIKIAFKRLSKSSKNSDSAAKESENFSDELSKAAVADMSDTTISGGLLALGFLSSLDSKNSRIEKQKARETAIQLKQDSSHIVAEIKRKKCK